MGEGVPPVQHSLGLSLRMDGLVWKGQDARGDWTGSALVSYRSFFYKKLVAAGRRSDGDAVAGDRRHLVHTLV